MRKKSQNWFAFSTDENSNDRDVVVDGMQRRTSVKSVRYAGELVVHEPLMQFGDICHYKSVSSNYQRRILRPLVSAPVSGLE